MISLRESLLSKMDSAKSLKTQKEDDFNQLIRDSSTHSLRVGARGGAQKVSKMMDEWLINELINYWII